MNSFNKTSIVYNEPNKIFGLPPYYYRWRVCDTNLNGNTPADQYQKLKLIQNTVRVNGSLYTSNLGPLTAYKQPISNPSAGLYGVCWNQMSDRPVPSVQRVSVPTGSNNSLNRRHTSVTSSKPGSQTPGGVGCDIKHNSYDRYLNRLKGKGPLRRGVIPPTFGAPIPFNPAFPVYGGKIVKTNIVSSCDCPIGTPQQNLSQDIRIYNDPLYQEVPKVEYGFDINTYVYAIQNGNNYYTRAIVRDVLANNKYNIQFDNGTIRTSVHVNELKIYFPCNCESTINGFPNNSGEFIIVSTESNPQCIFDVNRFL
jgi:hypothetical protein